MSQTYDFLSVPVTTYTDKFILHTAAYGIGATLTILTPTAGKTFYITRFRCVIPTAIAGVSMRDNDTVYPAWQFSTYTSPLEAFWDDKAWSLVNPNNTLKITNGGTAQTITSFIWGFEK